MGLCEHPDLAASTAYRRGCRCDRCRADHTVRYRRYVEANRERRADTNRRWREQNRESLAVYDRQWRLSNLDSVSERERRRRRAMAELTPSNVTGRYSEAEDRIIRSWAGSEVALAQALGRSWESVRGRKRELRKRGLLPRPPLASREEAQWRSGQARP